MLMRYYWGLAVGHTYTHHFPTPQDPPSDNDADRGNETALVESRLNNSMETNEENPESDSDPELMHADRDDDDWQDDSEDELEESIVDCGDCSDDDSFLAFNEMYGC
jgi:hypothetical protein